MRRVVRNRMFSEIRVPRGLGWGSTENCLIMPHCGRASVEGREHLVDDKAITRG